MSKFKFSVSNIESRREGVIESDSFDDAVFTLGKHVKARKGDLLEIGVAGFPPAHYECVGLIDSGDPFWVPTSQRAA